MTDAKNIQPPVETYRTMQTHELRALLLAHQLDHDRASAAGDEIGITLGSARIIAIKDELARRTSDEPTSRTPTPTIDEAWERCGEYTKSLWQRIAESNR